MGKIKQIMAASFLLMGLSGGAFAESTDESIAKLNEQMAILSTQVKVLDLQMQLATKQKEMRQQNGIMDNQPLPALRSIEGSGSKMFATLVYPDASKMIVEVGDTISDKWVVDSIGLKSIELKKGRQTVSIALRTLAIQAVR